MTLPEEALHKTVKLKLLWSDHQDTVLPKIIDLDGGDSTEELRNELDLYDSHVAGLVTSILDNEVDPDWLQEPDNINDMEARIAAFIALLDDIPTLQKVAEEYRDYKHRVDELFKMVRWILDYKL